MPDQIIQLDGKPFRKKGYWRAVAVAFNLTVEPVDERREQHGDAYVYAVTYLGAHLSLEWRQVDFAAGTITLDTGTTKSGEGRVFPFMVIDELRTTLESLRDERDRLKREGRSCGRCFTVTGNRSSITTKRGERPASARACRGGSSTISGARLRATLSGLACLKRWR